VTQSLKWLEKVLKEPKLHLHEAELRQVLDTLLKLASVSEAEHRQKAVWCLKPLVRSHVSRVWLRVLCNAHAPAQSQHFSNRFPELIEKMMEIQEVHAPLSVYY
jgi:hypothetical protein